MSTASILPASARAQAQFPRSGGSAAWLAARASDPKAGLWLVIGFAALHAVLWTLILVNLKTGQDVHMDVAEAYAWGQKFLLGYGKHPPLSGWVAGVWFMIFPVTDWATYALAMATLGCGLVICWLLALRVVDRRRAFLVVVMLALYPIFNFKGFKYNPDMLQLVTLPLVVLAYLDAFEKRSVKSGIWLGLAGALALMTKYWVLTMIGAIGLAALIHPAAAAVPALAGAVGRDRDARGGDDPACHVAEAGEFRRRSPMPARAIRSPTARRSTISRSAISAITSRCWRCRWCWRRIALAWPPRRWKPFSFWSRGANAGVNVSQALNVWIIQAIVAIGPPIGAVIFDIYIKTDWGIPLFFLVPLALVAIPAVRVRRIALSNLRRPGW